MSSDLLTREDRDAGFSLLEDDHVVTVLRWEKPVAYFSASGMTRDSLREFLDKAREAADIPTLIDQAATHDRR